MAETSDTRTRIIDVARVLFADHGFEGASIRDIAKAAEVNVASVNYHFTNKENLIKEILKIGYRQTAEEIHNFYATQNPNLEELLLHQFRHYLKNCHDLISSFKMVMSAQHSHLLLSEGTPDQQIGPPGATIIIEALNKEVGKALPEKDMIWAMRCIDTYIVQNAILYGCVFKHNKLPYTAVQDLEEGLIRYVRMTVKDLKSQA